MVDREEGVSYWCAFFITAQNKRQMKKEKTTAEHSISVLAIMYVMIILTMLFGMSSCKSTKYHTCDAYKTQYKPIKAEKHKYHGKCDAYN